jgi:hypothetical protein
MGSQVPDESRSLRTVVAVYGLREPPSGSAPQAYGGQLARAGRPVLVLSRSRCHRGRYQVLPLRLTEPLDR